MKIVRRHCLNCARVVPKRLRADAKYCSATCRGAHWQRRRRTARALARKAKCAACGKRIMVGRRADSRYCSQRCRQRDHRARKAAAAAAMPSKAHQRIIRERHAAADAGPPIASNIGAATVRPITKAEASAIVERFEWLGTMPAVVRHCFGIFFDGHCAGAVVYGDEAGENLGIWNRYGYTGRIISLSRGACLHWAHPHSASKLVRGSMKLLPGRYAVVTATVDAAAGEVGTIYQAAGFDYVGIMRAGGRALVRVNGRHISERQAGRLAGSRGARALAKLGFDANPVQRRARYFAFRGRERKQLRAAIAHLIRPYPKRLDERQ